VAHFFGPSGVDFYSGMEQTSGWTFIGEGGFIVLSMDFLFFPQASNSCEKVPPSPFFERLYKCLHRRLPLLNLMIDIDQWNCIFIGCIILSFPTTLFSVSRICCPPILPTNFRPAAAPLSAPPLIAGARGAGAGTGIRPAGRPAGPSHPGQPEGTPPLLYSTCRNGAQGNA